MKKHLLFLFFISVSLLSTFANDTIPAKIYFYRENNFQGSAVSYKIYSQDSLIVKLKNNSFFTYSIPAGNYTFSVLNGGAPLQLNVENGKIYYINTFLRTGFWEGSIEMNLVDSISAYPKIHNGILRELNSNIVFNRPPRRFGLILGGGGGFDDAFSGIETDKNKKVYIGFGGGFGIGAQYGIEMSKHFDLAFELAYRANSLSPHLDNGDMTFSRLNMSFTPSYIMPIDGGETMRMKFGAGLDYNVLNTLNIDCSDISGGFNDTWKYDNALGLHLATSFEMSFDNWILYYGLKVNSVKYKFKSGNKYFPFSDNDLEHPNGAGLDLMIGLLYAF